MSVNDFDIPPNVTIRQEYLKCGNPDCQNSHGPYLYAYWKQDKKLRKRYVGKNLEDFRLRKMAKEIKLRPRQLIKFMFMQQEAFKHDNIREKEFGKEMAVVTDSGETISTPIVYDTKTADSLTPKDMEKAKKYKTIHNTDYCIIVTKKGIKPKDCEKESSNLIGKREGIFLVHPSIVVGIARLMRNFMIENAKQTRINNGAESKYRRIYDYVTSPERFRKIEEKMLTKLKLDQLQKNEEEYHERKWKEWKKTIQSWYDSDMDDQKKLVDIAGEDVDIDDSPSR